MTVSLEKNVQILSEHYVNRFKHLIDTNRKEDAFSIGEEYVCKGCLLYTSDAADE